VDVAFVGTGAAERLPWLAALADVPGLRRRIYGNSWRGLATPGWELHGAVTGETYARAISGARVVLGLLRQANGDLSTDRSYEIGAIGGCGLYKDSEEHRALLLDYPDVGFFNTPTQLREHAMAILADPNLQANLRARGAAAVRRPEHTYAARLRTILEWERASKLVDQARWWEALDSLHRIDHPWWQRRAQALNGKVEEGLKRLKGQDREHDGHGDLPQSVPVAQLDAEVGRRIAAGMDEWKAFQAGCQALGGRVVEAGPETACQR